MQWALFYWHHHDHIYRSQRLRVRPQFSRQNWTQVSRQNKYFFLIIRYDGNINARTIDGRGRQSTNIYLIDDPLTATTTSSSTSTITHKNAWRRWRRRRQYYKWRCQKNPCSRDAVCEEDFEERVLNEAVRNVLGVSISTVVVVGSSISIESVDAEMAEKNLR